MTITIYNYKEAVDFFCMSEKGLRKVIEEYKMKLADNVISQFRGEFSLSIHTETERLEKRIVALEYILEKKIAYDKPRIETVEEDQGILAKYEIQEAKVYVTNMDVINVEVFDPHGDTSGMHFLNAGDQIKVMAYVKRNSYKESTVECSIIDEGLNFLTNEYCFKRWFVEANNSIFTNKK